MQRKWRLVGLSIISLIASLLLSFTFASSSYAHWADLSVAQIVVGETQTQITLTFPTGLIAFADDNKDNQLSVTEVGSHKAQLQSFFSDRLLLTNDKGDRAAMTFTLQETTQAALQTTAGTHSTLLLAYTWLQPVQGLKLNYNLFLPGVSTARCLATIIYPKQIQNYIFDPNNRELILIEGSIWQQTGTLLIAIAASFLWGGMHAMSPGHGKTIVGAYLVGSRATAQHAVFLGLTTTITHTLAVFALGLIALFASNFIVPDQLYPWLSCLSGLMVVAIGLNLFISRLQNSPHTHSHNGHSHHHHGGSHHSHDAPHAHSHDGHSHHHSGSNHSHVPPIADEAPPSWRSLLTLGVSGGIVPCPSALVVLLSAIALGRVGFGLVMVLAFSLGLAAVLTGLGLLLVRTKKLFDRLPLQRRLFRVLPAISAFCVALLGLGITTQALMQIGLVRF
ncbi:MAG: sulfite exporter TauE/SafE family protein [Chroococcus sp. CMT-3BRIN-NPC107]|jgi:ABC-type nickel/cobalt efflux system permease component RcnA|nr:sulfite exporter TauE/SafE family protein [Chroococcus sp. CMT-3BRIN-NPC107]